MTGAATVEASSFQLSFLSFLMGQAGSAQLHGFVVVHGVRGEGCSFPYSLFRLLVSFRWLSVRMARVMRASRLKGRSRGVRRS